MNFSIQRTFDYFLIGVLSLLPILIVVQVVLYVERLLRDFVLNIYGRYEDKPLLPVLLFASAVAFLVYFGYLLKQDKAHLLYYLEKLLDRIPVLGTLYRVTKKILRLFRGDEETRLRDVVYVEYPRDGLWVPAFVTNRTGDHCVVYVPTSPNPTSGFTVILHESRVVPSSMTIEEASSFVISLGVDMPKPDEAGALRRPG
ncbi:MAG: DUF502 domain-containing protein [Gammaproteobacteria bacterium]|nr:DUF502 domain-containing protein [Gammaproteobacteria bacterium]